MSRQEIIEKLLKLKILSEQGIGGEKENATIFLNKLMHKHGITEDELEEDIVDIYFLKYSTKHPLYRRLATQVIYSICGQGNRYQRGKSRSSIGFECTKSEALIIEAKYAFYKAKMDEELDIFYIAFVNVNKIFHHSAGHNKELSEEDQQVSKLMDVLKKHEFHKQLE